MVFLIIFWGLFGLIVGSFLSAYLHRLATGGSVLRGRSRCPLCGMQLGWQELIPVMSFLLQRGKCKACGRAIPLRYLFIEVITGGLFALAAFLILLGAVPPPAAFDAVTEMAGGMTGLIYAVTYYGLFIGVAVAVSFFDFQHRLIPRAPLILLIVVGLADKVGAALFSRDFSILAMTLLVSIGAFAVLWSLWRFSGGRAMGRGDADVAFSIALALGPSASLLGFLFALWLGAIVAILLVSFGGLGWKTAIPFGPFLFAGALISLFVIEQFLARPFWYIV